MKTRLISHRIILYQLLPLALCLIGHDIGRAQASLPQSSTQSEDQGAYHVSDRGANHRTWQRVTHTTNELGRVHSRTNSYTELASGLHYWRNNAWHESVASIEVTASGAEATNCSHKVCFEGNAHCATAIDLTLPSGQHLKSHVVGLSYYDAATGQNALIAELKDCAGEVYPPNQAVYADAFTDFKADIRYTHTKAGFEQDIILREQLASPTNYNFSPETTRLEVWTEFLNPPTPEIQTNLLQDGNMTENLSFGGMSMGAGQAFSLETTNNLAETTPVQKMWRTIDGRTFLIESVPYPTIEPRLQALPKLPPHAERKSHQQLHAGNSATMHPPKLTASTRTQPMILAKTGGAEPGYVIDYAITLGGTNFTNYVFKGDTTYYISSALSLYGMVTFEGGTVIKFNSSGSPILTLRDGLVDCQTDQYHPAVFTVKNDNSVGEAISGSTGDPSAHYYEGIDILAGSPVFNHMRFSYGTWPINLRGSGFGGSMTNMTLRNIQWVNCNVPVESDHVPVQFYNTLTTGADTAIIGHTFSAVFQNVTVDQMIYDLAADWDGEGHSQSYWTNCIAITTNGTGSTAFSADSSCIITDAPPALFQTVGAGNYYLTTSSPYRDVGTTNINSTLLADLRKRTTYPPVVYSNTIIETTTFAPQAQRDIDSVDLGYHYDPLDFVFYQSYATNAVLTVTPGTAIGYAYGSSPYGFYEFNNTTLISEGTATAHNVIARYNTVQEQTTTNWANGPGGRGLLSSFYGTTTNRFKWTDFYTLAQDTWHYYGQVSFNAPVFYRDCQFYGGEFSEPITLTSFTNCLFDRVIVFVSDNYSGASIYSFVNNLFHGGTLYGDRIDEGVWTIKDNLFDRTTLVQPLDDVNFDNGYNGYVTNCDKFVNNFGTDVILTNSPNYQTSFMGRYYYPTNLLLINVGSQNATNATLFHYTTTTNQWKETNSIVDIGFHYVATDTNGVPIDTDGDGLADYLEDANGNGVYDTPDLSDWNLADTDGDGINDYIERLRGMNPRVGFQNDASAIQLKIYTPLQ